MKLNTNWQFETELLTSSWTGIYSSLRWRHNGHDSDANHQPHDCLLNRLFRRRSKKTSKLRVTGLCAMNSPGTGELPAQMASNAENVFIWWRHHVIGKIVMMTSSHGHAFRITGQLCWTSTGRCIILKKVVRIFVLGLVLTRKKPLNIESSWRIFETPCCSFSITVVSSYERGTMT